MKSLVAVLALLGMTACGTAVDENRNAGIPPLEGEVLEIAEAKSYTYMRLKTAEGETWAAVGRAPVKTGARVVIDDPMVMHDFQSSALDRKFDQVVLGTLRGTPHAAGEAAPAAPHARIESPTDGPDIAVPKATGAGARTVAEVVTKRVELKDQSVQVRGRVVKFTGGVLGRNWLHLRDGTGAAADGSNDLVVTTVDHAKVGEVVLARGTVRIDRDIGSGYAYAVLVEDASLQQ